TDLFAVQPCRPYLIKTTAAATLAVTGKVARKPLKWRPKSFNLVGFPVDPILGGGSPAVFFFNEPSLVDQKKFRLTPTGTWIELNAADRITAGTAYWIFADESTTFEGSLKVEAVPGGDAINFGTGRREGRLIVRNVGAFPGKVTISNPGGLPLLREITLPDGSAEWQPFTSFTTSKPLGSEASTFIKVGLDRSGLTGPVDGFLEVSGLGTRVRLPVSASIQLSALASGGFAGLWVGNVSLNKVTEVASTGSELKDTPAEFNFRLILHVDVGGQVKLLKSVIMMWKDGTPGTVTTAEIPGEYVLLTDDLLIPSFKGARLRDGSPVGYRVSSIVYDFPGNDLPLFGSFGSAGSVLSGSIVIGKFAPSHPYRHKYHPDHDGLTPTFDKELLGQNTVSVESIVSLANNPARQAEIEAWEAGTAPLSEDLVTQFAAQFADATPEILRDLNPGWASTNDFARPGESIIVPLSADLEELWQITRAIELTFTDPGDNSPTRGDTVTGTYRETITGMHQEPLTTSGDFRLTRANAIPALNPSP
ncbi:MAG: hypothetical protein AAGJ79_15220, partial [Verrucomicrobiota bacterium]